MTFEELYEACVRLSVHTSYTTEDGDHDLTRAVLELQVCMDEMDQAKRDQINSILKEI